MNYQIRLKSNSSILFILINRKKNFEIQKYAITILGSIITWKSEIQEPFMKDLLFDFNSFQNFCIEKLKIEEFEILKIVLNIIRNLDIDFCEKNLNFINKQMINEIFMILCSNKFQNVKTQLHIKNLENFRFYYL